MKIFVAALLPVFVSSLHAKTHGAENPVGKVVTLLGDLESKVTNEGVAEEKAYKAFAEWCDDASKNTANDIKTAKAQLSKLDARIGALTSKIAVESSKTEQLAGAIYNSEAQLNNATVIRKTEDADFKASEVELVETIGTLGRAISIIERQASSNPALMQSASSQSVTQAVDALSVILDAASMGSSDQKRLIGLVQASRSDSATDDDQAPQPKAYKGHAGGIVDTLEDLKDKAEEQLAQLRKAETNARHNFEMLRQSLVDQSAQDTKDSDAAKAANAAAQEDKAAAEGDSAVTAKSLAELQQSLETARSSCLTTAADHEATVAAREEEIKVIQHAKQILVDTSAGAVSQSYSLLQLSSGLRMRTRADLARSEVVTLVKKLAQQQHSSALAQLASRIQAVERYGASAGEDPFSKVKGLIEDMISKLESSANSESNEKAYCDENMAKTESKKDDLSGELSKLSAKIDQAAARSADLKAQTRGLEDDLSNLAKSQAEMDQIRHEQSEDFEVAQRDLQLGLQGVRKALSVLREYYGAASAALVQDGSSFAAMMQQPAVPEAHSQADGAGSSIIGLLEVVESDFAKNLAKEETEEGDSATEYEKMTQLNKITRTQQQQDVKYKTKESTGLDKSMAELSSDRETTDSEQSAVLEFYSKLKERCIAKPTTYEERKGRREAEMRGLKDALQILEQETALLQKPARKGHFRGSVLAAH